MKSYKIYNNILVKYNVITFSKYILKIFFIYNIYIKNIKH